ncbi:MAG: hypothetical protein P8179_15950 [Candidatus Thiodiazotropha sp.]
MFNFFSRRPSATQQVLFSVPQADPFENPLVETNPEQLRQWATALPFANPQQLAESVITSLGRLNRYPKPIKQREELMQVYITPALRLSHTVAKRKSQTPIILIRKVLQELAYGYCHIANECISSKPNKKSLSRLGNALYHAIKYFSLEYLLACEEFDCRYGATYRQISRLMTFATEQNLHLIEMHDNDQPEPYQTTITHQYNRFLLLLLLDPCHLQEGEPRLCYEFLNTVAGEALTIPPIDDGEITGRYVIDRLGEVPPYLLHRDGLENLAQPRFALFDLNPVSQNLHHQIRRMEQSEQKRPESLSKLTIHEANNLLARMLKSWHIRLRRDSERHNTSGQVLMWIGVQQVHSYLSGEVPTSEVEQQEITMSQPIGINAESLPTAQCCLPAMRTNQSRSGVALRIPRKVVNAPLIGDLILISRNRERTGNDWKIGVVKRAFNVQENLLEFGIQFVLGKIEPITLRLYRPHHDEQKQMDHPGIFIEQGHIHRSSLIVPKHFFVIGQEYRIEEMIPAPSVMPLQLLESTARFERYRIKSI